MNPGTVMLWAVAVLVVIAVAVLVISMIVGLVSNIRRREKSLRREDVFRGGRRD